MKRKFCLIAVVIAGSVAAGLSYYVNSGSKADAHIISSYVPDAGIGTEKSSGELLEKPLKKPSENSHDISREEEQSDKTEEKINISECSIIVDDVEYSGEFTEPSIKVMHGGTALKCGTDYEIEFDGKTDRGAGKYYFTVTMTDKYEGSIEKSYNVIPQRVSFSSVNTRVSDFELNWTASENVDGYEIEISPNSDMTEQETLVIEGGDNTSYTKTKLPWNSTYYVRIRNYVYDENGTEKIYSLWGDIETVSTKQVEVIDGVTYIDGTLIVNKTYSVPEYYGSGLDEDALGAFTEMADQASADGIYLYIVSGFRSYWTQYSTYNYFCSERGISQADRVSARPGHSEHQTGLSMDINSTSFSFEDTPEAQWRDENCWRYGFIIRYPRGKEEITGYAYEPWHIRYVGRELAEELYNSGLTLEEYFGITSRYDY